MKWLNKSNDRVRHTTEIKDSWTDNSRMGSILILSNRKICNLFRLVETHNWKSERRNVTKRKEKHSNAQQRHHCCYSFGHRICSKRQKSKHFSILYSYWPKENVCRSLNSIWSQTWRLSLSRTKIVLSLNATTRRNEIGIAFNLTTVFF